MCGTEMTGGISRILLLHQKQETGGRRPLDGTNVESGFGTITSLNTLCVRAKFSLVSVRVEKVHGVPSGDE